MMFSKLNRIIVKLFRIMHKPMGKEGNTRKETVVTKENNNISRQEYEDNVPSTFDSFTYCGFVF